jgi:hypothetical protein
VWDPGAPIVRCVEGGVFAEEVVRKWFDFPRTRGYLLVHHEIMYRVASKLREMGVWEIVWVDEVHRISNTRAQVSKAVKTIPTFYKWGTSGTVIDRSPADFWSILNWFQPNKFGSYWAFYNDYVREIRRTFLSSLLRLVLSFFAVLQPKWVCTNPCMRPSTWR